MPLLRRALAGAALTATAVAGMGAIGVTPASAGTATCPSSPVSSYRFTVTGTDGAVRSYWHLQGHVRPGDHIVAQFNVAPGCRDIELSLASYRAPASTYDKATANQQILFDSDTGTFDAGKHTLQVDVFGTTATSTAGNPNAGCDTTPGTPTGRGANQSAAYDTTCTGMAAMNGQGAGAAVGEPCAGCVGNADDKNPPGQVANGNDANAGYECDTNRGGGQTNPAHTGCQSFQVDFVYGSVLPVLGPVGTSNFYSGRIIDKANG